MINWKTSYSSEHFTERVDAKPHKFSLEDDSVIYLVDVLETVKEEWEVSGTDIKIDVIQTYNNNFREALPSFAKVVEVYGKNPQFKVGDVLSCNHFSFVDQDRIARPFKKNSDGTDLYKLDEADVYCSLSPEGVILKSNKNIIIGLPITDQLIKTNGIVLTGDLVDYRRDVCKVLKVWEDCDLDIDEDKDYLLLDDGGDYIFTWKKVDYIAVDFNLDGAVAVVDTPEWRDVKLKKHMKDHNDLGYGN